MGKTNEQRFAETGREDIYSEISYNDDISLNVTSYHLVTSISNKQLFEIYHAGKEKRLFREKMEVYQRQAERMISKGEEDERKWRFCQEAAGVILTGAGVAFSVPAASAAGGVLALAVAWIGLVLGIMQLMYGLIRTLCTISGEDKAYEIFTNDENITKFFQIVDLLSTLLAVGNLLKTIIPGIINLSTKLQSFKNLMSSVKQSKELILKIETNIENLTIQLEKETKELIKFKTRTKISNGPAQSLKEYQKMINAVKTRIEKLPLKEIRYIEVKKIIQNQISQLEDELVSEQIKHIELGEYGFYFLEFNEKRLVPMMQAIKNASYEDILSYFSMYANSQEGYGISTGTLYDLYHQAGIYENDTTKPPINYYELPPVPVHRGSM